MIFCILMRLKKLLVYTLFSSKVFSSWLALIREKSCVKEEEALQLSRKHLLQSCWRSWYKVGDGRQGLFRCR